MAALLYSENPNFEFFAPTAIRRSNSRHKLAEASPSYAPATPTLSNHSPSASKGFPDSASSTPYSSPRTVHAECSDLSFASTPATNLSIASDLETFATDESLDESFELPPFDKAEIFSQPEFSPEGTLESPPSPKAGDSYTVSPGGLEISDNTLGPGSLECQEHAEDDTAVTYKPSRQVDYLSHDWKEEDLWASWSYVVTRRNEFGNGARLENASWRTWAKVKHNLPTVSPETLNWLKDCDVTWLYGPLQLGPSRPQCQHQADLSCTTLSKSDSFNNLSKKPILKKRSMSEIMLQRSLTTSSLLKQAAAAVQAQEAPRAGRPSFQRSNTDCVTVSFSSRRSSQDRSNSLEPSTDSSGLTSPLCGRKHIHFNEQVEQCIAIDVKGDDDDADTDRLCDECDSDDGFMMKRMKSKMRKPARKRQPKNSRNADGKIIAKLPSTKLKYREDTPEPPDTAMKHSTGRFRSPIISPSSSQETLKPSRSSRRFCFGEEEDDGFDDGGFFESSVAWTTTNPNDGIEGLDALDRGDFTDEPEGMHRTPSGMFMPYEPGVSPTGDGVFARVVDTINTARDIAHVIWNVGWRR